MRIILKYLLVVACLAFPFSINAQNSNAKYGMIDTHGNVVIPFNYDNIEPVWQDGYSIVTKQNNKGVFAHNGIELVPSMYQNLKYYPSIGFTALQYGGKWGIMNNESKLIVPFVHSGLRDINLEEKLIPLMINNQIILLDYNGNKIDDLPLGIYENYYMLGNGLIAVSKKGVPGYGIITLKGRSIASAGTYDMVSSIKGRTEIRVSKCSDQITCFSGLMNLKGDLLTTLSFDDINVFYPQGDNIIATRKGKTGTINSLGQPIIAFNYTTVEYIDNGFYSVMKPDNTYGVVDEQGKEKIPCKYEKETTYFPKAKLGRAKLDFLYALLDENGNAITDFIFDEMGDPSEDLIAVVKGIKSGFINRKGEQVIPCIYADVQNFSEGRAVVIKDGQCGVIDTGGQVVIPFGVYEKISTFSRNVAVVYKNGKYGIVNNEGKIIVEPTYKYMDNPVNGLIIASK